MHLSVGWQGFSEIVVHLGFVVALLATIGCIAAPDLFGKRRSTDP